MRLRVHGLGLCFFHRLVLPPSKLLRDVSGHKGSFGGQLLTCTKLAIYIQKTVTEADGCRCLAGKRSRQAAHSSLGRARRSWTGQQRPAFPVRTRQTKAELQR